MTKSVFLVSALLFGAMTAQADTLTYDVNLAIGTGLVTGTITTDGVLGSVAQTDVQGWNLSLSDPTLGLSTTLTTATSQLSWGSGVTASPSTLTFDFSTPTDAFLFTAGGLTPGGEWYLNAPLPSQSIPSREHIDWWGPNGFAFTGIDEVDGVTGTVTFATTPAPVPLPSSVSLLAIGLVLVGFARRRWLTAR